MGLQRVDCQQLLRRMNQLCGDLNAFSSKGQVKSPLTTKITGQIQAMLRTARAANVHKRTRYLVSQDCAPCTALHEIRCLDRQYNRTTRRVHGLFHAARNCARSREDLRGDGGRRFTMKRTICPCSSPINLRQLSRQRSQQPDMSSEACRRVMALTGHPAHGGMYSRTIL